MLSHPRVPLRESEPGLLSGRCDVPRPGCLPSGYYAWTGRPPSARTQRDATLTEKIRMAHTGSNGTYGASRIHAELADQGVHVGRKRVAA